MFRKSSPEQIFSENWRWVPLEIAEEDTILTALDMTANMEEKLKEILESLKKLDVIELLRACKARLALQREDHDSVLSL